MRILMLGNSFTVANDMLDMLAELTGAEVTAHTRGGARLAEHLNPKTKMGARTQAALKTEHWDYVVLQEMSNGPVVSKEKFLQSAAALCEAIREAGAVPVFYATWAYQKGQEKMNRFRLSYEEMYRQMTAAYQEAAQQNGALLADVGTAFYEKSEQELLYAEDGCHPNEAGSRLAAERIARVIWLDQQKKA